MPTRGAARLLVLFLLVLLPLLPLVAYAAPATAADGRVPRPVLDVDFPDPSVVATPMHRPVSPRLRTGVA